MGIRELELDWDSRREHTRKGMGIWEYEIGNRDSSYELTQKGMGIWVLGIGGWDSSHEHTQKGMGIWVSGIGGWEGSRGMHAAEERVARTQKGMGIWVGSKQRDGAAEERVAKACTQRQRSQRCERHMATTHSHAHANATIDTHTHGRQVVKSSITHILQLDVVVCNGTTSPSQE